MDVSPLTKCVLHRKKTFKKICREFRSINAFFLLLVALLVVEIEYFYSISIYFCLYKVKFIFDLSLQHSGEI